MARKRAPGERQSLDLVARTVGAGRQAAAREEEGREGGQSGFITTQSTQHNVSPGDGASSGAQQTMFRGHHSASQVNFSVNVYYLRP